MINGKRALILGLIVALGAPAVVRAGDDSNGEGERVAIEAAARDYIDGWYEGDAERIARGLHPDLAKRVVRALPSGTQIVSSLTYHTMVEYTKNGFGSKSKKPDQVNEVVILDVSPTTASVKTISYEYIDYLHLAKIGDQWRIINVLWEPNPTAAAKE
jgi:hypothetical protein